MGGKIELNKKEIINIFPELANDPDFQITSPADSNYNCIAWAYKYKDRWMEYGGTYESLDGVLVWWPDGVENSPHIDAYINAFRLRGYEICDNWQYEKDFERIALYINPDTLACTHAAREKRDGKWTSKLGKSNDIAHANPYTIEGNAYGKVACIMRRKWE
jgi:hypothetical protein